MEYKKNPVKAIREKCIECMGGQTYEVAKCTCERCPIYPFRLGKNPFRTAHAMSEEQKAIAAKRLQTYRESKAEHGE